MKKRKVRRLLGLALVTVLLSFTFTGCGGSEEKKEEKKAESDGVLTVGLWGGSNEEEATKQACEGIQEAVPGIKEVKLQVYTGALELFQKLPGQIAAGTAPDLVLATNEQYLQLITEGLLLPLDEYDFDLSDYASNAVETWRYEDKLYGIPLTMQAGTFTVNDDMWKEAGLGEYPKTWDEVYEASKVLTKGDVKGLCLDVGNFYHPTQYFNSFGGGWKGGKDINSEENVKALEFIFKMFDEGLACTAKDVGMTWDGEVFAANKCAMTTSGPWYIGMMEESAPDTNYSFIPMPGGDGNSGAALHCYAVSVVKTTPDPELAAKAAYYLTREESQTIRGKIVGERPARESVLDTFYDMNPRLSVMEDYIATATGFGYPADQAFETDFTQAVEAHIYADDKTPAKEILDTLAENYGQ